MLASVSSALRTVCALSDSRKCLVPGSRPLGSPGVGLKLRLLSRLSCVRQGKRGGQKCPSDDEEDWTGLVSVLMVSVQYEIPF